MLTYYYHYYPEKKYLIAFIYMLPVIKNNIKCIITIYRYLLLHTYFPLSYDELHNNITNITDYKEFISLTFRFKPLPKTMKLIFY